MFDELVAMAEPADLRYLRTYRKLDISEDCVQCGDEKIKTKDISAVRFGSMEDSTYDGKMTHKFLKCVIEFHGAGSRCMSWEFAPKTEEAYDVFFRNGVRQLYEFVAPSLLGRLVRRLKRGNAVSVGKLTLGRRDVTFTSGVLLWKENHSVIYRDLQFVVQEQTLKYFSATSTSASGKMNTLETWNAVILPDIVEAMK